MREQSYRQHHPAPQDVRLVVEYSYSTQAQDTSMKRDLYAEAGISDYLVVDLKRAMIIHYANPVNGQYGSEQTFTAGIIRVGAVFVDVDQLLK